LEPLVEVLNGQRYVHAHCYRSDEILMLIRIADEMGFKIRTFQHALEGYKVAAEIKAHGAGASTFSDWWAYKIEAYDATPYNAALMTRKGVLVSVNSDSDELQRHLNLEAAKSMRYGGLSETEALAMVTINPAKQLGIDDKVGSIEVGKSADLVLFEGHPLSNFSKVLKVWIDGHQYFDRDQDLAGRAAFEQKKKALIDKEKPKKPAIDKPNENADSQKEPA
jgi:imidazolonepropionase-like amidohydrolase